MRARLTGTGLGRIVTRGGSILLANALRAALAFATTIYASHLLGTEDFGRLVFLQSLFLYLAVVFEFGVSSAVARLIAHEQDRSRARALLGVLVTGLCLLALIEIAFLLLAAPAIALAAGIVAAADIRLCALFATGLLLQLVLRNIAAALGQLPKQIAVEVVPWLIYGAVLLVLALSGATVTYQRLAVAYVSSFFFVGLVILAALRPSFAELRPRLRTVAAEARRHGLNLYLSRLVGSLSYIFDASLVAMLSQDARVVAQYGFAKNLAAPVGLIAQSLAMAVYRDMAGRDRIPPAVLRLNGLVMAAIAILGIPAGILLLPWIAPPGMGDISLVFAIWMITAVVGGISTILIPFLDVHGYGHSIRNASIAYALSGLLLQVALVPRFGVYGASLATLLTYAIAFGIYAKYYKDAVRTRMPRRSVSVPTTERSPE